MNDREILAEIGRILYACTPNPEEKTQLHANYKQSESAGYSLWNGEYLSKDTSFGQLPDAAGKDLIKSIYELGDYFIEHNLGEWNLMHYVLLPNGKSFEANFEYNVAKSKGELILYKYLRKFRDPNVE